MGRNSDTPQIFSMSFLDLIFCAMAGVLVLYVIADRAAESSEQPSADSAFVEISYCAPGASPIPGQDSLVLSISFVVEFDTGTAKMLSHSWLGDGTWVFDSSSGVALIRLDQKAGGGKVRFRIHDLDFGATGATQKNFDVRVRAFIPGRTGGIVNKRATINFPDQVEISWDL